MSWWFRCPELGRALRDSRSQEADEVIVGLPVSADGRETPQSNKARSAVGRLAVQAAQRGLRVYLQDEYGTSKDALDYLVSRGVKESARDTNSDAYAAVVFDDDFEQIFHVVRSRG